jgi:hypothetical protein
MTKNLRAGAEAIERQFEDLRELQRAAEHRRRQPRGSAAYQAALEREEKLDDRIRRWAKP